MLILSRNRDEQIVIGDDIVITVVEIRGDRVRLGIISPVDTRVDRIEVRERIDRECERVRAKEEREKRDLDAPPPLAGHV